MIGGRGEGALGASLTRHPKFGGKGGGLDDRFGISKKTNGRQNHFGSVRFGSGASRFGSFGSVRFHLFFGSVRFQTFSVRFGSARFQTISVRFDSVPKYFDQLRNNAPKLINPL